MRFYVLRYNNYVNREIKKFDTLDDYRNANCIIDEATQYQCNFKENDGVDATQVVNIQSNIDTLNKNYELKCNYALVTTDTDVIISRWFVVESTKTRDLQFNLTLHRDVIADNYDAVVNAPAYIERATIRDINSPLLYNKENDVSLNQVKTGQYSLGDATQYSWVVMYLSPKILTSMLGRTFSTADEGYNDDIWVSADFTWDTPSSIREEALEPIDVAEGKQIRIFTKNTVITVHGPATFFTTFGYDTANQLRRLGSLEKGTLYKAQQICIFDWSDAKEIECDFHEFKTWNPMYIDPSYTTQERNYWLFETSLLTIKCRGDMTRTLQASDYFTLCMPYKSLVPNNNIYYKHGNTKVQINKDLVAIDYTMQSIKKFLSGSDYLYDMQILPYCPLIEKYKDGSITYSSDELDDLVTISSYDVVSGHSATKFNCSTLLFKNQQFETEIPYNYNTSDNPTDKHIFSNTRMLRICSPNYASVYELDPYANGGLQKLKVCCNYKPYSPYIYVAPVYNYNSMYGNDYQDARGCVCSGNYSVQQLSDQWMTYALNNINNQAVFNTGIDTLQRGLTLSAEGKLMNLVQSVPQAIADNNALGTIGAGLNLAATSLTGQQAIDNTTLIHNLNIDNIKARADTLKRMTDLAPNRPYHPYMEEYDCTNTEKQALRQKLKYNGMRVGVIGKIADYTVPNELSFVQADLIKLPGFAEDAHMLSTIKSELQKGVYI